MLIDAKHAKYSSNPHWDNAWLVQESPSSGDSLRLTGSGRESLGVSRDAAFVHKVILEFVRSVAFYRADTVTLETPLIASLFPTVLDIACLEIQSEEQERLQARLNAAFEAELVEDGMRHPAETIIAQALEKPEASQVLSYLKALSLDATRVSLAASVLRCLGRQERPGTESWRIGLVRDGLAVENVEIRDAVTQAAELWGDYGILNILKTHIEPVSWLRDYIQELIDDLEE